MVSPNAHTLYPQSYPQSHTHCVPDHIPNRTRALSPNAHTHSIPISHAQFIPNRTRALYPQSHVRLSSATHLCCIRERRRATLASGIVLASNSEPLFHLWGFLACFSATFARALKSVLQGLLLTNENEKLDSLNLLLFMSPVALLVLVVATVVMEPTAFGVFYQNCSESPFFFWVLLLNCVIAFSVNLTNFLVTKCTSPLTLQVLGNAKGAVAVVISILLFKNPVSSAGMIGYTITLLGVVFYSEAKKRSTALKKRAELRAMQIQQDQQAQTQTQGGIQSQGGERKALSKSTHSPTGGHSLEEGDGGGRY